MSKLWSFLITCMMVLTLGVLQLPKPCMGDGHGNACQVGACICVAACSCHAQHAKDEASSSYCPRHHKRMPLTAQGSCHGEKQWPHFAPSRLAWDAVVPPHGPLMGWFSPCFLEPTPAVERHVPPALAPPERPPRSLA